MDIKKIYRAFEMGLVDCFPYKNDRISGAFHSDHLHIAPNSMEYRRIMKSRFEQVTSLNCPICIFSASNRYRSALKCPPPAMMSISTGG